MKVHSYMSAGAIMYFRFISNKYHSVFSADTFKHDMHIKLNTYSVNVVHFNCRFAKCPRNLGNRTENSQNHFYKQSNSFHNIFRLIYCCSISSAVPNTGRNKESLRREPWAVLRFKRSQAVSQSPGHTGWVPVLALEHFSIPSLMAQSPAVLAAPPEQAWVGSERCLWKGRLHPAAWSTEIAGIMLTYWKGEKKWLL